MWAAGIDHYIRKCLVEKEPCVAKQHQQPVGQLEVFRIKLAAHLQAEEMKQEKNRKGKGVCTAGRSRPGPGEIVMQRF